MLVIPYWSLSIYVIIRLKIAIIFIRMDIFLFPVKVKRVLENGEKNIMMEEKSWPLRRLR